LRLGGFGCFTARKFVIAAFFAAALAGSFTGPGLAQESDANSNRAAATPTPPPSPTPISLSNAVTDADTVAARLRVIRTAAEERPAIARIANEVPTLRQRIDILNV